MRSHRYQLVACAEPLQRSDMPQAAPQGRQVLLRMLAAGVCHTDLHLADGYFDLGRGQRIRLTDRGITLPHTLGHENVGEVVALGPEASGVSLGQRVLAYPWIGCQACALCAVGDGQLCASPRFLGVFRPGGFATHLMVPDARYLFDIGSLNPAEAAPLACSGLTAWSALMKVLVQAREGAVVILGAGGLGLMCLSLLRQLGAAGAWMVDPSPQKRAAALEFGALGAYSIDDDGQAALAKAAGTGVGAVLDFVGSPTSITQGVSLLRKGGQLVVVGMYGGELALPIPTLVLRGIGLQGSYVGSLREMHELMGHVARHGLPPLPVTTRALDDVDAAMASLRAGEVVGRCVLCA